MAPFQRVATTVAVLMLMLLCYENACTVAAASMEEEFEIRGAAGKYNANVPAPEVQSQLHREVVRALRTAAQYSAFAALLDNMTDSVIREGITVFAPNNKALSDFQKTKTGDRLQDVIRLQIITVPMPFSNLLRLAVGSTLTTAVANLTIEVTNTTAGAYEVDDAMIVDPDLYTDATIAVHGVNAVFNTSRIAELGAGPLDEEPLDGEPLPTGLFPSPRSHAYKFSSQVKGVSAYQILMPVTVLYILQLSVGV